MGNNNNNNNKSARYFDHDQSTAMVVSGRCICLKRNSSSTVHELRHLFERNWGGNPDDGTVKAEIRTAEFVAAGQASKLYQKIQIIKPEKREHLEFSTEGGVISICLSD